MTDVGDLDSLPSRELHHLAMRRARQRMDVRYLWDVLRAIPAAEAVEGRTDRTGMDLERISALISDALLADETGVADALRPLYIDYLTKHGMPST